MQKFPRGFPVCVVLTPMAAWVPRSIAMRNGRAGTIFTLATVPSSFPVH